MTPRPASTASEPAPTAVPRLDARLGPPAGRLRLGAGEALELPDHPAPVAALQGHERRREHRIRLDGRRLDRRSPSARVRAGLVTVGDAPVAPGVSVRDHLAAVTRPATAERLLAATPHLADLGPRPAGLLSGGERRLLGWALAQALDPSVVLLDRAGSGLDAEALAWTVRIVATWRARGTGVLVRVGRAEERRWLDDASAGPRP